MKELHKIWSDTLKPRGKYSIKRILVFSCFWLAAIWGTFSHYVWYVTGQDIDPYLVGILIMGALVGVGIDVKGKIEARNHYSQINTTPIEEQEDP